MDFTALADRLGLDTEDFIELTELFVTTTESDMAKISQGMSQGCPGDAAAAAHSIKGAAGNLGFEEMAEIAKIMEFKGKEGSLDGFEGFMEELATMVQALKSQLPGA